FDFVASTNALTELTTLEALAASEAICDADGFEGSALTSLDSVSTDVLMALVSLGKSDLAEATSAFALLWIVLSCACRPLSPADGLKFARSLIELSSWLRSAQKPGLSLPPHALSASGTHTSSIAEACRRARLTCCADIQIAALMKPRR